MKKIIAVMFVLILIPSVSAYSFGDFMEQLGSIFTDHLPFTGGAIAAVKQSIDAVTEPNISSAAPPSVKKVVKDKVVEDVVDDIEEEDVVEDVPDEEIVKTPSCSDYLDNNVNYYVRGVCKDNRGPYLDGEYPMDYCSVDNSLVMEFSCVSDSCAGSWYVCENGCEDGACIMETEGVELVEKDNFEVSLVGLVINPEMPVVDDIVDIDLRVKNVGTTGGYFENFSYIIGGVEVKEYVNYFLQPGETVDVDLVDKSFDVGTYGIFVSVDDDELTKTLVVREMPVREEVTGNVVVDKKDEKGFFVRIFSFFSEIF